MTLAYSSTRHFKCQEQTKIKSSKKITEKEILLNSFNRPKNSTSIPAYIGLARGRAIQKQQIRHRGQEDHDQASKFIYGDVPSLRSTIKTPNEATTKPETQP